MPTARAKMDHRFSAELTLKRYKKTGKYLECVKKTTTYFRYKNVFNSNRF